MATPKSQRVDEAAGVLGPARTDEGSASGRCTLSRRSFLAVASAAVGAALRPSWVGATGDRPGASGPLPPGADHVPVLRVPRQTKNGARVPIVVDLGQPMTPAHHVTCVRVTNESDPISSKGTFHFTPANGRVHLAFQARMHEGASVVTAAAECTLHGISSASAPIEIPAGAGGCLGGASEAARPRDDIRAPVIRIPELIAGGAIRGDEVVHVQVTMRHPNRTGLVFRDGRFVPESEPLHLDALEVFYGDEPVSHFALTAALSDDPLITFCLLPRREGRVRVIVTNNRGQRFEATHELRVT